MEIFIPDDMKRNVDRTKQFTETFIHQFKHQLEQLVPIGYTLKIEDAKHINVYRTPENAEDLRWTFKLKNIITNYTNSMVISEDATAVDIYKLCGLMQLLVEVDVKVIGNVLISK